MRFLFTALIVLVFGQLWSQSVDDYVKKIEELRIKGKLTTKSSTDKTIVGSVTAYYNKDSLVLINSLTDAEEAGTELLYFYKDDILKKVFIISASFDSNKDWTGYYSRHKSLDKCYTCHGERRCIITEVVFNSKPTVATTGSKKIRELTQAEKEEMLMGLQRTSDELRVLVKEL